MDIRHFVPGQYIDVRARTKSKGFAGGMKRWGFKGLPATHGVSLSHRSIGSTGQRQDPGKVFKGKKMPGRMGGYMRTGRNLQVYEIYPQINCMAVIGTIPGHPGSWIKVNDALLKKHAEPPPFPTYFPKEGEEKPHTVRMWEHYPYIPEVIARAKEREKEAQYRLDAISLKRELTEEEKAPIWKRFMEGPNSFYSLTNYHKPPNLPNVLKIYAEQREKEFYEKLKKIRSGENKKAEPGN